VSYQHLVQRLDGVNAMPPGSLAKRLTFYGYGQPNLAYLAILPHLYQSSSQHLIFMKLHILLLALALQFSIFTDAVGQNKSVARSFLAKQFSNHETADASLNHLNYFEAMADEMQFAEQTKMVLKEVVPGENGFEHYKFQQLHDGLPVFGGTYILHEKNGVVVQASGNYCPKIDLNTKPSMSASSALDFAKQAMKADTQRCNQPPCFASLTGPSRKCRRPSNWLTKWTSPAPIRSTSAAFSWMPIRARSSASSR
jgi:Fungalysin/Thermolysin Propeptide Motif